MEASFDQELLTGITMACIKLHPMNGLRIY